MLGFDAVTRRFGPLTALDRCTFTARPGRLTGFLGPNGGKTTVTKTGRTSHRLLITVLTAIGVALGVTVAVLTSDVIVGVIAGAGFIAIATQMVNLWTRHNSRPSPLTEDRPCAPQVAKGLPAGAMVLYQARAGRSHRGSGRRGGGPG
jgi:hypothetical protein